MTETQVCTRCEKIKPTDQFKLCEKCRARMRKQYYLYRQEKELSRKDWMDEIKVQIPCTDCGKYFREEPWRLQWDHLPGMEKLGNVSDMVSKGLKKKALEEIKKCELVCGPCHSQRGIARGQIKRTARMIICDHCGRSFLRQPCQIQEKNYCSRKCAGAYRTVRKRIKLKVHYWKPPKFKPRVYSAGTIRRAKALGIPLPDGTMP